DVPFEAVNVEMGHTDRAPYDDPTFGSMSLRVTGLVVRQAAAEMRQWLMELGSQHLGERVERLITADGAVRVAERRDVLATYAELASGRLVGRQISGSVKLKSADAFNIVGTSVPRIDVPDKVTGALKFGYDIAVANAVHGAILRPPSIGAALQSIDFSAAQSMPGVVGVVRDGDFV